MNWILSSCFQTLDPPDSVSQRLELQVGVTKPTICVLLLKLGLHINIYFYHFLRLSSVKVVGYFRKYQMGYLPTLISLS